MSTNTGDKRKKKISKKSGDPAAPASAQMPAALPRWKFVLFSLLPLVVLILLSEAVLRLFSLDVPRMRTSPLPEQLFGLLQPDPELFWSLRPNVAATYAGAEVSINSAGLRGPELAPKQPDEFRILSLGESTTFGVGVSDAETYTASLQTLLRELLPSKAVVTINGGVSAYSSFQSLKYLELRGLELRPDVVLFYHEVNDYLPSALRDSSNSEVGALKTDRQLYDSNTDGVHRALMGYSAIYRSIVYRLAYRELRSFGAAPVENPVGGIGLPRLNLMPRLREAQRENAPEAMPRESTLGQRVSESERKENFERLASICREKSIALIVIHPSYRKSVRHDCLLTKFCSDNGVAMFEAHDVLHPPEFPGEYLFLDSWHPTREGQFRLAQGLARYIKEMTPR